MFSRTVVFWIHLETDHDEFSTEPSYSEMANTYGV